MVLRQSPTRRKLAPEECEVWCGAGLDCLFFQVSRHVFKWVRTRSGMPEKSAHETTQETEPSAEALRITILELARDQRDIPPERQLTARLKVSRSRLRRVLADLRATGQLPPPRSVVARPRGAQAEIDRLAQLSNPTEVIELRFMLEPKLARLAAIRASAVEIARIMRAATGRPSDSYGGADLAFHLEVVSAARNALGRELYAILRQVGTDKRVHMPPRKPPCQRRRDERDREHMDIAQAIAARDPDRAEAAMRAHLAMVQDMIDQRLSPEPSDARTEPLPLAAGAS